MRTIFIIEILVLQLNFLQNAFSKDLYPGIDFETCGTPSGNLEFIRVSGCENFPCTLRKGQPILVEIIFTPSYGDSDLSVDVRGIIADLEIPWPGIDKDACKFLVEGSCPFIGNNRLHYAANMTISPTYPNLQIVTGQWKMQNKNGVDHICMHLRIRVASPTPPTAPTTPTKPTTSTETTEKMTTVEDDNSGVKKVKSLYFTLICVFVYLFKIII